MVVTEEKQGAVAVLTVEGRIDTTTAPQLEAALVAVIERGERTLLLDLGGADYISSAGLRALLVGARAMEACRGSIALVALQAAVKEVLAVTGFLNLFRHFKSREIAVRELDASR